MVSSHEPGRCSELKLRRSDYKIGLKMSVFFYFIFLRFSMVSERLILVISALAPSVLRKPGRRAK